jgi:hypothetical protein
MVNDARHQDSDRRWSHRLPPQRLRVDGFIFKFAKPVLLWFCEQFQQLRRPAIPS